MLRHLPPDTGMAFVFIQHLDPKHASRLPEILSGSTAMPVLEATDGLSVKPDHVYVIPPDTDMAFSKGRLTLSPRSEFEGKHMTIDFFFKSLAGNLKGRAIGIVLSGTASDGTLGLKAIKTSGGTTFAQDEKTAKYEDMPRNAIASGYVDFVLPPEKIALRLVGIRRHPFMAHPKREHLPAEKGEGRLGMDRIFDILRKNTGVDFSAYKRPTIMRRLKRRMSLHKIESLSPYIRLLEQDPAEVESLRNDILILVTSFFRDPKVYQALTAKALPKIMKGRPRDSAIRVWVPGCSTGEEAYSIAIALVEFLEETGVSAPIQIFGTDVSRAAIEKARKGIYKKEGVAHVVSPKRLRRFFVRSDGDYQISKFIRDLCVFAEHDLTRDPPFSSLDLVSCRNVMIYLEPSVQKKIVRAFHYALKPEGLFILGNSETTGDNAGLFHAIDKKSRIYMKKPQAINHMQFDYAPSPAIVEAADAFKRAGAETSVFDVMKEVDRVILSRYSPAGVLVNHNMEIMQFRGQTGPYLEPAPGKASLNLLKMLKEGLSAEVHSAIRAAEKSNAAVEGKESIRIKFNGKHLDVRVDAMPVKSPVAGEKPYFLVSFINVSGPVEEEEALPKKWGRERRPDPASRRIARLEQELARAKEHLRSIMAEGERSNEELRVASEEVLSSNEELQSMNEELETAKEELQSANEELNTVNEELQNRNLELGQANDDLINFLASAQIPLVMLNRDLKIRRYTPIAEKALKLIPSDVGRSIGDAKLGIDAEKIDRLIMTVIDTVSAREREVRDREGRWYRMQILPYKTLDNRIDGAVMAFFDIDAIKRSSNEIKASLDFAEAIVETVREPLLVLDRNFTVKKANSSFFKMFKVPKAGTIGRSIFSLGNKQWDMPALRKMLSRVSFKGTAFEGLEVERKFPVIGEKTMLLNGRRILMGEHMLLLAVEDITERKHADISLRRSLEEKEVLLKEVYHRVKNNLQVVSSLLTLQSKYVKDKKYAEMFLESQNRIKSMALVHEKLYQSGNLAKIDLDGYIVTLAEELSNFYGAVKGRVAVKVLPGGVHLSLATAIPCGLIINELLTNSLKYAFPGGKKGRIIISLLPAGRGEFELTVKDSGVGLPDAQQAGKTASLGLHLVTLLAERQLKGKLKIHRGRGAEFIVRFKGK